MKHVYEPSSHTPESLTLMRSCVTILQVALTVSCSVIGAHEASGVVGTDFHAPQTNLSPKGEMKRVVMIRYTSFGIFGACGVIVNRNSVLTAKHAVKDWKAHQIQIKTSSKSQPMVSAKSFILHPREDVDLAMIRLRTQLENLPRNHPPLFLKRTAQINDRVWLGGYGIYGPPGQLNGVGLFHSGKNRISRTNELRATIMLDKPDSKESESTEALPAGFDSGTPVWTETDDGWALSGISVTATNRHAPDYGDTSSHQLLFPVMQWLEQAMSDCKE